MIAMLVLKQMMVMFILMGLGVYLYRKNIIDDEGTRQLSNLLLQICTPLIIVSSLNVDYSTEKLNILLVTGLISIAILILGIVISHALFKEKNSINVFASIFSNAGFIGIPLVSAILGEEYLFILTVFIFISNIFVWTIGVGIITGESAISNPKKLYSNGAIIASLIGLVLFFSPFTLPEIVAQPISMAAGINTVLAMLILGTYISKININHLVKNLNIYKVSFIRLIVIPIATVLLLAFIPVSSRDIKNVLLIAYAAPVGVICSLFSQKFDRDAIYASTVVGVSTILSILTIPFILMVAEFVWQ